MIDTAFIFQVPAHYPVVTFVSSSFFSPSRAREKKEGYNRQIQPEEIDEPNEKWNSGSSHSISSSSYLLLAALEGEDEGVGRTLMTCQRTDLFLARG